MKRKIVITTNHPAIYITQMCKAMEEHYDVTIIYKDRVSKTKQWKNVDIKEGLYYDQLNLFSFLKDVYSADLVIIGGWVNFYAFMALILSPFFKTTCAISGDHPEYNTLKKFSYYIKKYLIYKCVEFKFCATLSTITFLYENYGISLDKLKLYPYAYDSTVDAKTVENINRSRINQHKIKDSKIRLFIASRFIKRKGYDTVVNAFKRLNETGNLSKYEITIAGSGEMMDYYTKVLNEISTDIKIVGWIETEDYLNYLLNTDIYLHPSLFEPSGIPPLDAMYRKKLVIASDGVESLNGIMTNGVDGYIYKADDGNALFEILSNIKRDKIYVIAEKGYETLMKNYPHDVYYNTIESCCRAEALEIPIIIE